MNKKDVNHENKDFNDPHLKDKVKELIGNSIFEKYIFCWSAEEEVKKYASDNYKIRIVQFPEIINAMIDKVSKSRRNKKWIYDQFLSKYNAASNVVSL